MNHGISFLLWLGMLGLAGALPARAVGQDAKKVLFFGSRSCPDDTRYRQEILNMEAAAPYFDGLRVGLTTRGGDRPVAPGESRPIGLAGHGFGPYSFPWDSLGQAVDNFAAVKPRHYEVWIRFNTQPGLDFFSYGWVHIIHNARMLGRAVQKSGAVGIWMDVEAYHGAPFNYNRMALRELRRKLGFKQYADQAFRRGQQFMRAINAECPKLKIMFTWAHSRYWRKHAGLTAADLSPSGDLLAPFLDGMLAASSDKTVFIDGYEDTYGVKAPGEYVRIAQRIRQAHRFSRVPGIYKRKMRVGFGLMIDARWRKRGGWWPDDPEKNYWTDDEFAVALAAALQNTDQYVWIWAESMLWFRGRIRGPGRVPLGTRYPNAIIRGRKLAGEDLSKYDFEPPPRATAVAIRGRDLNVHFRGLWKTHRLLGDLPLKARFQVDPKLAGEKGKWFGPAYDDRAWKTIEVGKFWENKGYVGLDGVAWYRLRFAAPRTMPPNVQLSFGAVDEKAKVWLNGRYLGEIDAGWDRRAEIDASGAVVAGGRNVLAVRVYDGQLMGGLWGPIKLVAPK